VNNESSEIIRMFNSGFRAHTNVTYDFIRKNCAAKSIGSTISFMAILITACTGQALRAARKRTTKQ